MSYGRHLLFAVPSLVLTGLAPLSWYVSPYSTVIHVTANLYIAALLVCAAMALFRGAWWPAAIFIVPVLLGPMLWFGCPPYFWLEAAGFRLSIIPIGQYLRECNPTQYSDNGLQHAVGYCGYSHRVWDEYSNFIIYDTAGQLKRIPALRPPQWKNIVRTYPAGRVLADVQLEVREIFGPFYAVYFGPNDAARSADAGSGQG